MQGEIPIVQPGAMEETSVRVTRDAQGFGAKCVSRKVLAPCLTRVKEVYPLAIVVGHVDAATAAE